MMTSDYPFHQPLDPQSSKWNRMEAANRQKAALRKAGLVLGANVAGFGLLAWLAA